MSDLPRAAGGFFLILPVLAGFGYGLAEGDATLWTAVGLGIGTVFALIVWIADRRKRG